MRIEEITEIYADTLARLGGKSSSSSTVLSNETPMESRIEHTLLGSNATSSDVDNLCRDAVCHRFRSVCVLPRDVARTVRQLEGTGILSVVVVDFPLGGGTFDVAAKEARLTVGLGAHEVDMVIDVRAILEGDLDRARHGIAEVVNGAGGRPVKVILETGYLSSHQVVQACAAAAAGGASFVKTSTGFGIRGASVEDIRIMRGAVGKDLGIKASGGIRSHNDARILVEAGADLIGTSNGPACLSSVR